MKINFQVDNVHNADPALKLSCVFSQLGGYIGSGMDAGWRVQDITGAVPAAAARVAVMDGRFTIEALSTAQIRVNGAGAPLVPGRPVALSDKDVITLGALAISVRLSDSYIFSEGRGISDVMEHQKQGADVLVTDGEFIEAREVTPAASSMGEPLAVLDRSMRPHFGASSDPMQIFDTVAAPVHAPAVIGTVASDSRGEMNVAVTLPRAAGDAYGFEPAARPDGFDDGLVDHVALRPLAHALGLPVRDVDTLESSQMLAEIGATLRAAVTGLNRIYNRSERPSRFPLATMHMHVIEDNPLRFARTGQEAMEALFSNRGAVHLSAPAALSESLDHLARHQDATENAVDRALDAVFMALKPAALERRFASYARDAGPAAGPERDAWCWRMYKAYFSELASQRQKGLQMLFWEVFAYEYQALMRAYAFEDPLHPDQAEELEA